MIKILLLLLFVTACNREEAPDDDYVLIEFASKLEEDYKKLSPEADKENQP